MMGFSRVIPNNFWYFLAHRKFFTQTPSWLRLQSYPKEETPNFEWRKKLSKAGNLSGRLHFSLLFCLIRVSFPATCSPPLFPGKHCSSFTSYYLLGVCNFFFGWITFNGGLHFLGKKKAGPPGATSSVVTLPSTCLHRYTFSSSFSCCLFLSSRGARVLVRCSFVVISLYNNGRRRCPFAAGRLR